MKVFVYGSLRKNYNGPMSEYLRENGEFLGEATIEGLLYDIAWFPGVVEGHEEDNNKVVGDLFEIQSDEVLTRLDNYEGHPVLFERRQVPVYQTKGTETLVETAWVYFYNKELGPAKRIEDGDWLANQQAKRG